MNWRSLYNLFLVTLEVSWSIAQMQMCSNLKSFYDCRIGRTPWFIAYDTKYDSIVISIRGTWSIQDVVTDILAGALLK